MPLPLLLAAVGAAKGINALANFFGQRSAGRAALHQGEMEQELFGKNAALADKQAADAIARGEEAALRQSYRMRLTLGSQNAAFAGGGVELKGGTAQAVIRSDQALGEADRLAILENAHREAQGFTMQADIQRFRGQLAYTAGRNRQKEENIASIGTLANYAGDMFSLYKQAQ